VSCVYVAQKNENGGTKMEFTGMTARPSEMEAYIDIDGSQQQRAKILTLTAFVAVTAEDFDEMPEGAVLVTRMTAPEYVRAMKRAAAIITQEGGVLCHAAIVSREFGIPCVVGLHDPDNLDQNLMANVKTGDVLTINPAVPMGKVKIN
jgi:phosphoenolpyruvate synthase/pyruvate phosphate dikinase